MVIIADTAGSPATIRTALFAFALRFADLLDALELSVAVASLGTGLPAGPSASVVSALLTFAAWLAALIFKNVCARCAHVIAAIADEEAKIVALAVVLRIVGAAKTFARGTFNARSLGTR